MNKQIVGCMVAVMMSVGVGCASQSTENLKSPEEVVAALKLQGATDFPNETSATGSTVCYRPQYCKASQVWICCYTPGDMYDPCGYPL